MTKNALAELDATVEALHRVTRQLPGAIAQRDGNQRAEWVRELARGRHPVARFAFTPARIDGKVYRALDHARELARSTDLDALYLPRLEELELELAMMEALGDARRVRPMAARRFGTGAERVVQRGRVVSIVEVARGLLGTLAPAMEPRTIPARRGFSGPSLEGLVHRLAAIAGLEIEVKVDPTLVASAAAGDHTVFLADRSFGRVEAVRLAVHEVLGHLVSAANARLQPLRILAVGTAGSFEDQEGLAIVLEEQAGVLDDERLRTLAGRVLATHAMHDGAVFGDVGLSLVRDHGFTPEQAMAIAERAFRGGGVARDTVYLRGWLRVRTALATGDARLDGLRRGRVALADQAKLDELVRDGRARPPIHAPSLARSLSATLRGTSFDTSPPSRVTSLQRFEAT